MAIEWSDENSNMKNIAVIPIQVLKARKKIHIWLENNHLLRTNYLLFVAELKMNEKRKKKWTKHFTDFTSIFCEVEVVVCRRTPQLP